MRDDAGAVPRPVPVTLDVNTIARFQIRHCFSTVRLAPLFRYLRVVDPIVLPLRYASAMEADARCHGWFGRWVEGSLRNQRDPSAFFDGDDLPSDDLRGWLRSYLTDTLNTKSAIPMPTTAAKLDSTFAALADPTRRAIVARLAAGD